MSALTVFNFQDCQVRSVTIDGEPWFVARDVLKILGYAGTANTTRIISHVPDEWKGINPIHTPGGSQDVLTLSEHGLFFFLGRSDKPAALPLQKFVAGEVLPSIRKTGSYSIQREPLTEIDRMAGMMNQMMPAIAGSITEIRAVVAQQTERLAAVEERQKEIDPQAIDAYRVKLHAIKDALVAATKGQPQQVTYDGFWRELKRHCGIGSFALTNQAALTVPLMEKAHAYAISWCEARGVKAPSQLRLVSNERSAV